MLFRADTYRPNILKMHLQENSNYTHRPTAVIYMVAAGRFLVGRESLHKLPRADFVTVTGLEVELTTDHVCEITADSVHNLAGIYRLNGQLVSDLAGNTDGLFQADNVEHNVVIVNLLVRLVLRGKLTLFTLYANNLIQHILSLFPLGLLLYTLYCQHSAFCTFRSGSRSCGLCQDYKTLGVVLLSVVIFFTATKGVMIVNTETTYTDLGGEDYSQNELDKMAKQKIEQIAKERQYDKNT